MTRQQTKQALINLLFQLGFYLRDVEEDRLSMALVTDYANDELFMLITILEPLTE